MQQITKAIVLKAIKYGDSSLIVKAYTASNGLKSYLLQGVLSKKRGKFNKAHFLPLSQLELVVHHKDKGGLERILEARVSYAYQSLYLDVVKNSMGMFLADFLSNAIQEEGENPALFEFIETALQWVDTHEKTANFHLSFLLSISKYFGFYPSDSQSDKPYFDLAEASFVDHSSIHPCISGPELTQFKSILGINFDKVSDVKMSQQMRKSLLHSIMSYYTYHLEGFRTPKSIQILHEVFS